MKVLFLVDSPAPYGANIALINLLDGLTRKGVKPYVTYARKGPFTEWLEARGIECFEIPYHMSIYSKSIPRLIKNLLDNYRSKKELIQLVQRIQPDIIHTNIGPLRIGYDVARKLNIRHVWHVREYQRLDFGLYFFPCFSVFKKLIKNSYTICITKGIHEYFNLGKYGRVIYDGVLSIEEIPEMKKKQSYFLFVGRLEKAKGIEPLIETFAEFIKSNDTYKLYIAGTGTPEYEQSLGSRIRELALSDKVKFLGFRKDRYELMQAASALIVPSLNEGFGFISAEAMFNSCLLLGRNTAGTKEIIENSNGSAFSFNDETELLNLMTTVAQNGSDYYLHHTSMAKEIALEKYTIEKHVASVYSYYKEILNDTPRF